MLSSSAKRLPRIAWLSPLPPQKSGIANYSYQLVKALKSHLEIDLYCDNDYPAEELKKNFNIYALSLFPQRYGDYDEVIYHLGNNSLFHKHIYEIAWDFPGTIVLHDYNLSGFLFDAFYQRNGGKFFEAALLEGYGEDGRKEFEALRKIDLPQMGKFAMSHGIVARSKRVIVHHRWVRDQFPGHEHVKVIPHFAKLNYEPSETALENFRAKFGLKPSHFVVCCAGFVNNNKLPFLQIQALQRLRDDGYPVQMLFAGAPDNGVERVAKEMTRPDAAADVVFTGYLDEPDYFSAIVLSDVILNLRNPSMGEASGTLMHALAAAKPTIVSDSNQYKEFPDKVCWKLPHDENELETLCEYLKTLLSNRSLRAAISANAADHVRNVLALEKIAAEWLKTILNRSARSG